MITNDKYLKYVMDEVNYYIDKSYGPLKAEEKAFIVKMLVKYGSELISLTQGNLTHDAKTLLKDAESLIDTSSTTIARLKCSKEQ